MVHIIFGFGFLVELDDGLHRVCSSALSHAGKGTEPDENEDGEPDELDEEEVVDEPGTTIGT